jgi:hypothetical protein
MYYGQAVKAVNGKQKQLPKLTIFTKASFSSNISYRKIFYLNID